MNHIKALYQFRAAGMMGIIVLSSVACSDVSLEQVSLPVIEKTFNIHISSYCPNPGNTFTETFAHNLSAPMGHDRHQADSDADGLTDELESSSELSTSYGFSIGLSDSNSDGYSDFLIHLLGRDLFSQSLFKTCEQMGQDTDQDGITDCDEDLIKTDIDNPDTDADGIPDGIEVRFGTNPLDAVDGSLDSDHDGLSNLKEIKLNTPINYTNDDVISSKQYIYKVVTKTDGGRDCYDVTVANIPHMNLQENVTKIFFLENQMVGSGGTGEGEQLFVRTVTFLVPNQIGIGETIFADIVENQIIDAEEISAQIGIGE